MILRMTPPMQQLQPLAACIEPPLIIQRAISTVGHLDNLPGRFTVNGSGPLASMRVIPVMDNDLTSPKRHVASWAYIALSLLQHRLHVWVQADLLLEPFGRIDLAGP